MAAPLGVLIQVQVTVKQFLTNLINKAFLLLSVILITSCVTLKPLKNDTASWYLAPTQNNASTLYGVGQGFSLEEATKAALSDAASRLMVSISSSSTLMREENRFDVNEESKRIITQNIEKIDFANYAVSQSQKIGAVFFIEVSIQKHPFLLAQKEKLLFLKKKASFLAKNLNTENPVQKRASLTKIIHLYEEMQLSARILEGLGEDVNLREILSHLAGFENQHHLVTRNITFYINPKAPQNIANLIQNGLNKDKITISKQPKTKHITLNITSRATNNTIYGAYIVKMTVVFENILQGKHIASHQIEITGSSVIGPDEARASALKSLETQIANDGILKIIGILN